jgi:hypothetical protein
LRLFSAKIIDDMIIAVSGTDFEGVKKANHKETKERRFFLSFLTHLEAIPSPILSLTVTSPVETPNGT